MIKFFFTLIVFLSSVAFVFAEQAERAPAKKIAFYNKFAFDDGKNGIIKLHQAYNQIEMTDCFPSPCGRETVEKQREKVVEPVLKEISDYIKQIKAQNNIIILEISEIDLNGQILSLDSRFDITKQVIEFINKRFSNSTEGLKLEIPDSRIAIIDTTALFDPLNGIKSLTKERNNIVSLETAGSPPSACQNLFNSFQAYTINKGFSFILNSSKKLPVELENFPTRDITKEFISYYNQNNQ